MSSSNKTPHYDLPQFLPTDKPSWQGDVNGAMSIIDTNLYSVSQNATSASGAATAAQTAAEAAQASATAADTKATEANTAAQAAQTAATAAQTAANTAVSTATGAETKVTQVQSRVDTNTADILDLSTQVETAQTTAETAQTTATNANSLAAKMNDWKTVTWFVNSGVSGNTKTTNYKFTRFNATLGCLHLTAEFNGFDTLTTSDTVSNYITLGSITLPSDMVVTHHATAWAYIGTNAPSVVPLDLYVENTNANSADVKVKNAAGLSYNTARIYDIVIDDIYFWQNP